MQKKANIFTTNIPCGLYVLKHKDLDVAMVEIDIDTGKILYVLEVYLPEELPVGYSDNPQGLTEWWESRAIPDSRRGIRQVLDYLGEKSNLTLMLSSYGLSLTDHYWMQPIGEEQYWKDLNFYENNFSDELGSLLTDSDKIDVNADFSKFSPVSSVNGEMKKKWVIQDGVRYLMKVNANDYGQQAINEVIASKLHERLGWDNYVIYRIGTASLGGEKALYTLCRLFTSKELEFVSGYQLIRDVKIPNDCSEFEEVIRQSVKYGIEESIVRKQLEYTILTDFILSNTDRHYNNFGFLYDSAQHKIVAMAPVFDTGNALFYDQRIIPQKNLLGLTVNSFKKKEAGLLEYVTDTGLADTDKLEGFSEDVFRLLSKYTDMPADRAGSIAGTVTQKIEYLRLLRHGKKIWKPDKYWQG